MPTIHRETYDWYINAGASPERAKKEAERSAAIRSMPYVPPLPEGKKQKLVTDEEIISARAKAVDALYIENLGKGMDNADARGEAISAIDKIQYQPVFSRDGYNARPAAGPRVERTGVGAVVEALKPQTLVTSSEAKEHAKLEDISKRTRSENEARFRASALEGMDRDNLDPGLIEERVAGLRKQHMGQMNRQAVDQARAEVLPDLTAKPTEEEQKEIVNRASAYYQGWLAQVYPEYTAGGEQKEGMLQGLLAQKLETGELMETPLATGMRDLGGLIRFVTDPAMKAISYEVDDKGEVVDKEDFNYKVSQWIDDKALPWVQEGKSTQASKDVLTAALTIPAMLSSKSKPKKLSTGNYLKDVAIGIAEGRSLGDDFAELPVSQKFWTEAGASWVPYASGMAVEIALPVTPIPGVQKAAGVLGSGAGKLKGLAGTGRVSKVLDVVEFIGKGIDEPVDAVRSLKARKEAGRIINEAAGATKFDTPLTEGHTVLDIASKSIGEEFGKLLSSSTDYTPPGTLSKELLQVWEEARIFEDSLRTRTPKSKIVEDTKGISREVVSDTDGIAEDLTRTYTKQQNLGLGIVPDAETNLALLGAEKFGRYSKEMIRSLLKALRSSPEILKADDLGKVEEYIEALRNADSEVVETILPTLGKYAGISEIRQKMVADFVADRVKEVLVNRLPNNYLFLTPTTVVSTALWKSKGSEFSSDLRKLVEVSSNEKGFVFKNRDEIISRLADDIGARRLTESTYWKPILQKIAKNEALDSQSYSDVVNSVTNTLAKEKLSGTKLQSRGPAAVRAAVPEVRRMEIARVIEDLTPNMVFKALERAKKSDSWVKETARRIQKKLKKATDTMPKGNQVSLEIYNWYTTTIERLKSAPDEFIKLVKSNQGQGDRVAAFNKTIDDLAVPEEIRGNIEAVVALRRQAVAGILFRYFPNMPKAIGTERATFIEMLGSPDYIVRGKRVKLGETEITYDTLRQAEEYTKAWLEDPGSKQAAPVVETLRGQDMLAAITSWGIDEVRMKMYTAGLNDLVAKNSDIIIPGVSDLGVTNSHQREALTKFLAGNPDFREKLVNEFIANSILGEAPPLRGTLSERIEKLLREELEGTYFSDAQFEAIANKLLGAEEKLWSMMYAAGVPLSSKTTAHGLGAKLIRLEDSLVLVDPEMAQALTTLRKKIETGELSDDLFWLKPLEKGKNKYTDWMLRVLDTVNRATVGGFLGGGPLPNLPYLMANTVSAPFMTAITVPGFTGAAIKNLPRGFLQSVGINGAASDWMSWSRIGPKDIVFTDKLGKKWTKEMLEQSIEDANIKQTQVGFEYGRVGIEDIKRQLGLLQRGKGDIIPQRVINDLTDVFKSPTAPLTMARDVKPWAKNLWNRWAELTDMSFREGVYIEALKRGMPESQAGELARNAILDYGKVSATERATVARFMVFYAFQRVMLEELATMSLRGPEGLRNIRRMSLMQESLSDPEAMYTDQSKTKLFARVLDDQEGYYSVKSGYSLPPLEAASTIVNLMYNATHPSAWAWNDMVDDAEETYLSNPILSMLFDLGDIKGSEYAPHGSVPASAVNMFSSLGVFDIATQMFHLEPMLQGSQKIGGIESSDRQWRFADAWGKATYLMAVEAMIAGGVYRNLKDWAWAIKLASGYSSDVQIRRGKDGIWEAVLYEGGASRVYTAPDYITLQDQVNRKVIEQLHGISKR